MKKYEFLCGGDHGAWECLVTVSLTNEEAAIVKEQSKNDDQLTVFPPTTDIFLKVIRALEQDSLDEIDMDSVIVWIPHELRSDIL